MTTKSTFFSDSEMAAEFWEKGKSLSCPVIDTHGHMDAYGRIFMPRMSAEAMIATMDDCGLKLLIFSHHLALLSAELGVQESLDAVHQFPDRLRAYLVVHPNYPRKFTRNLKIFEANRDVFVGFKFHPTLQAAALDHPGYKPAWEYAEAHALPVLSHTWGFDEFCGAEVIRSVAGQYPHVPLLLGHSVHDDWMSAVELALEFPNIYLELTAVLDDRGPLELFVKTVGSRRLLFGTDIPWFDPHYYLGSLFSAHITDEDRHNICHRNAEKLFAPFIEGLVKPDEG